MAAARTNRTTPRAIDRLLLLNFSTAGQVTDPGKNHPLRRELHPTSFEKPAAGLGLAKTNSKGAKAQSVFILRVFAPWLFK